MARPQAFLRLPLKVVPALIQQELVAITSYFGALAEKISCCDFTIQLRHVRHRIGLQTRIQPFESKGFESLRVASLASLALLRDASEAIGLWPSRLLQCLHCKNCNILPKGGRGTSSRAAAVPFKFTDSCVWGFRCDILIK